MHDARPVMGTTRRDLMGAMIAAPAAMAFPGVLHAATDPAPLKFISLLARKPELSRDRFRQHWLGIHAPMASGVPNLRRFVLSETVQEAGNCEGLAIMWYGDLKAMRAGLASQQARDWLADGDLFINRDASRTFLVREKIVIAPPPDRRGIKQTMLLTRRPGLSRAAFLEHWTTRHAALTHDLPGLSGAVFNSVETSLGPQDAADVPVDGIAELWWDTGAVNIGDGVTSPRAAAWAADGATFIDQARSRTILNLDHVVIDLPHAIV